MVIETLGFVTNELPCTQCGLEELDNNFKAASNNRRKINNRFDEEGVFSMNCARHGVPMRLYDVYGGEG